MLARVAQAIAVTIFLLAIAFAVALLVALDPWS